MSEQWTFIEAGFAEVKVKDGVGYVESPSGKRFYGHTTQKDEGEFLVAAANACRALGLTREAIDAGALREMVEALRSLLWPKCPSGDDVALMIRMAGGPAERSDGCMYLADNLRDAQAKANAALAPFPTTTPTESTAGDTQ